MKLAKLGFLSIFLSSFILVAQASNFSDGLRLYDAKDYVGAFKLWEQQAKEGIVNAQHNVGVMLDKGQGIAEDKTQAIIWFKKAAEQGHIKSQYTLGSRYFYGKYGVAKNHTKAIYWWEKASAQGSLGAKYNLGVLHSYGNDEFLDSVKAKKWLQLALADGHPNAQSELDKLELRLAQDKKEQPIAGMKENKLLKTEKIVPTVVFLDKSKDKKMVSKEPELGKALDKKPKNAVLGPDVKLATPRVKSLSKENKKSAKKSHKSQKAADKVVMKKPRSKSLVKKKKRRLDWVSAQPRAYYTIQLAVAGNRAKAKNFITQHKLGKKAHIYKIKNKKLHKIIIGSYPSSAQAQRAIRKLSPKLRRLGIWPKKFIIVHKEKES